MTSATQPSRELLVHQQTETPLAPDVGALPFGPRDGERRTVAAFEPAPGAPHRGRIAWSVARSAPPQCRAPRLGHDQEPGTSAALRIVQIELQAIPVNVVGLLVECERRGGG